MFGIKCIVFSLFFFVVFFDNGTGQIETTSEYSCCFVKFLFILLFKQEYNIKKWPLFFTLD